MSKLDCGKGWGEINMLKHAVQLVRNVHFDIKGNVSHSKGLETEIYRVQAPNHLMLKLAP